jgi:hypothetical protein
MRGLMPFPNCRMNGAEQSRDAGRDGIAIYHFANTNPIAHRRPTLVQMDRHHSLSGVAASEDSSSNTYADIKRVSGNGRHSMARRQHTLRSARKHMVVPHLQLAQPTTTPLMGKNSTGGRFFRTGASAKRTSAAGILAAGSVNDCDA